MTVREWYETNGYVLKSDNDGIPVLWIVDGDNGELTIVDCNTSAKELGYRDESDQDVDDILRSWDEVWG